MKYYIIVIVVFLLPDEHKRNTCSISYIIISLSYTFFQFLLFFGNKKEQAPIL